MTYTFHVVVEREAHQWRAYCPAFESYEGAPVPVDVEIPNGTLISVEI